MPRVEWFSAPDVELAFGCSRDRYLDITKSEAAAYLREHREAEQMADLLFSQGHLGEDQFGMANREWALPEGVTPEDVRQTMGALLRSFGVSHEIKIATVAAAIETWFPTRETSHA